MKNFLGTIQTILRKKSFFTFKKKKGLDFLLIAVERDPVLTRVLNPNASEGSYKLEQRSYRKKIYCVANVKLPSNAIQCSSNIKSGRGGMRCMLETELIRTNELDLKESKKKI